MIGSEHNEVRRPSLTCFLIDGVLVRRGVYRMLIDRLLRGGLNVLGYIDVSEREVKALFANGHRVKDLRLIDHTCKRIVVAVDLYPWPDLNTSDAMWENPRIPSVLTAANRWLGEYWKRKVKHVTQSEEPRAFTSEANSPHCYATRTTNESREVIRLFAPERLEQYDEEIRQLRSKFHPPYPIVKPLTQHSSKSRTDLVRFGRQIAVCKTFRPSRMDGFESAVTLLSFSDEVPAIPEPLEIGQDWVVIPYYENYNQLPLNIFGLIPVKYARCLFESVKKLHDMGYAYGDLKPSNVLCNKEGKVKIVDVESVYAYKEVKPSFERGIDVEGLRCVSRGYDVISEEKKVYSTHDILPSLPTYKENWYPKIGVDIVDLMDDSMWMNRLRRSMHVARNPYYIYKSLCNKIDVKKRVRIIKKMVP